MLGTAAKAVKRSVDPDELQAIEPYKWLDHRDPRVGLRIGLR